MSDLYRLVYTSRNLLQEGETALAVPQILAASQANNARIAVTGALMFNGGAFAQVLEGPRAGVEETFERIQRDARHGDVTVLQCGPVQERAFSNWSMAFVGQSEQGRRTWEGLASQSGFDLTRLDGDAVCTTLQDLVLEEENIPPAPHLVEVPSARVLHPESFRVEAPPRPEVVPVPEADAPVEDPAVAVLRRALAQERQRTTDLRDELDTLRITLHRERAASEADHRERDLWMERARCLAEALCREAELVRGGREAAPRQAA